MIHKFIKSCQRKVNNLLKLKCLISRIILCACTICLGTSSHAQGVSAGTNISNIAIVSYSTDSISQGVIESSPTGNTNIGAGNGQATEFVVDRKVDLLVTANTNANVTPGDLQAEINFTLQNQGNATQEFSLVSDSTLTSDDFDINGCNLEVTGVSGTPLAGVTLPTTGNINLLPDQQATVSIKCDVPLSHSGAPIISGQTALIGLLATTVKNEDGSITQESNNTESATSIETVYADTIGTDDANRDASHSARGTYVATSSTAPPELNINKTIASVLDPDGGSQAISGSEVTYKININTIGIGTIENVVITDPTPIDMTYKANSILLNNSIQTDISDVIDNTDFGISTANTATINLGSFAAGNQHEILVTYIIN